MMAAWPPVRRRRFRRCLSTSIRGVRKSATIAVSTIEENTFLSDRFKTEEGNHAYRSCIPNH